MATSNYEFLFEGMIRLDDDTDFTRVWIEQYGWKTEVIAKEQWDSMLYPSVTNVEITGNTVSFTVLPSGEKVEWAFRPYINVR